MNRNVRKSAGTPSPAICSLDSYLKARISFPSPKLERHPAAAELCVYRRAFPFLAILVLLGTARLHSQHANFENTLLPVPAALSVSGEPIAVTSAFALSISEPGNPLLLEAGRRMLDRLQAQTLVLLDKSPHAAQEAVLNIEVENTSVIRPSLGMDESYTM
jgi:hypothetical protein